MKNAYGWDINSNDAQNYINICNEIVTNKEVFNNFKSSEYYNNILEHVDYELGKEYYGHIQKFGKEIFDQYLNKFLENDLIGNPRKFNYENVEMSPTTIRYIKNVIDLSSICADQEVSKIVEVGGGYGGLCKTLSVLCDFSEYLNIDLPEALQIQKKYLENFSEIYPKIEFVPCNELENVFNIDLFISNYSLSELNIETQMSYYDKLIKHSKIVYITYNLMINNCENNYNLILSRLTEDGFELKNNYHDYGNYKNKVIVGIKNIK